MEIILYILVWLILGIATVYFLFQSILYTYHRRFPSYNYPKSGEHKDFQMFSPIFVIFWPVILTAFMYWNRQVKVHWCLNYKWCLKLETKSTVLSKLYKYYMESTRTYCGLCHAAIELEDNWRFKGIDIYLWISKKLKRTTGSRTLGYIWPVFDVESRILWICERKLEVRKKLKILTLWT